MNVKKNVGVVVVVFTIVVAVAQARAGAAEDTIRQLGRGLANIAVGVVEIPESILEVQKEEGEVAAISYGTLQGVWRFGVRETVGVFEVVTSPLRYEPIVRPEFPAPNGVLNTVLEANQLPDEGEVEDWEVDELRLNR